MPLRLLHALWKNTLNSVPFGIATMASIAIYIAVGSGMASVREHFEMHEIQFFSAWPIVVLMIVLVLTLSTVTLTRIPFTPPRYGVWCVHVGIVTLVFGMFAYYSLKVEGQMLIPLKETAEHFYDTHERAIFSRVDRRQAMPVPLPALPRFASYPASDAKSNYLNRKSLRDIRPVFMVSQQGQISERTLGQELGLSVEPSIDVIGYHPYADIVTDFAEATAGQGGPGIKLSLIDDANGRRAEEWLVENSDGAGRSVLFETMFDHRHIADPAAVQKIIDSANKLHRLDILAGAEAMTLFVEIGKSYDVGQSGYQITIESYLPNWRTMQGETVDLLTFMVKSPSTQYRRQVIPGRQIPTDWKLDEPGAGPMGARQDKPLDDLFKTLYTFADANNLLGGGPAEKRTLITTGESEIVQIHVGRDRAAEVTRHPDGKGEMQIVQMPRRGPFQPKMTADEIAALPRVKVLFERKSNVLRNDLVIDVPKAKRDRDEGASGVKQVATVRVKAGDWSRIVHVPYAPWAAEDVSHWTGGEIWIPNATRPLRLQLGNTLHPMPAKVTLERFDLVPYAGGDKTAGSLMRDFKSTLRVQDLDTGAEFTDVAHMNHPVYLERSMRWFVPNESWLLFQSQWDPQAQRWTVLGVGNRPGVVAMTVGSIMIGVGLLYAFYVKPIVVARMKRRAIQQARETSRPRQREELAV